MASSSPPAAEPLRPLLVRAVAQALMAIFYEHAYADKVIEAALRQNPKAGSRDRAFIAETTYEVVRHFRLYTELLGKTPSFEPDFWALVGIHFLVRPISVTADADSPVITTLPDWREFQQLQPEHLFLRAAELRTIRKFRESIPDWLDALGEQELPGEWDATLAALNQPARVVLRANRLKTDRPALQAALQEEGVETVPAGEDDALLLVRRQNVFKTKVFHAGWFEMQDLSSQQVATFLAPAPGMRVVDACAGGGGKNAAPGRPAAKPGQYHRFGYRRLETGRTPHPRPPRRGHQRRSTPYRKPQDHQAHLRLCRPPAAGCTLQRTGRAAPQPRRQVETAARADRQPPRHAAGYFAGL